MSHTETIEFTDNVWYPLRALYNQRPDHLKVLNFSAWLNLYLSDALNGSL